MVVHAEGGRHVSTLCKRQCTLPATCSAAVIWLHGRIGTQNSDTVLSTSYEKSHAVQSACIFMCHGVAVLARHFDNSNGVRACQLKCITI